MDSLEKVSGYRKMEDVVSDPNKLYGLAFMCPSTNGWFKYTGSSLYIMGCHRSFYVMSSLQAEQTDDWFTNMLLYELDKDLKCVKLIKSMSFTPEESVAQGGSAHSLIIHELSSLERGNVEPFDMEF